VPKKRENGVFTERRNGMGNNAGEHAKGHRRHNGGMGNRREAKEGGTGKGSKRGVSGTRISPLLYLVIIT
jgi:hypothetical protein